MMTDIHITAWRDGTWWVATSSEIEGFATQVKRLDQLPGAALDIAVLADDVDDPDDCEFHVSIEDEPVYS